MSVAITIKYLSISAECPQGEVNARYAEEHFALEVIGSVLPEGSRVSNYGVNWTEDPKVFKLHTLVWRKDDSSWAKEPLHDPEGTDQWLRAAVPAIKTALGGDYSNVKVVLVTEVSTTEDL